MQNITVMLSRHGKTWPKISFYQVGSGEVVASPRKSSETSKPWNNWLREQEHKQCSLLAFQSQGVKSEESGKAWCYRQNFGFLVVSQSTQQPCLLAVDGVDLFQRRKLLLQHLLRLTEVVLD